MIVYVETNFILIEAELNSYGCKYITGFKDGLGYLESELRKAG
jgi:hypothetical protein